jgi:L-seryl-tRNA(Ser) seleniumtransferase
VNAPSLSHLPSVDRLIRSDEGQRLVQAYGRTLVTGAIRDVLNEARTNRQEEAAATDAEWLARANQRITVATSPSLKPVFNLTGTVLHTNLGRAPLPAEAIDAVARVWGQPANLEFDLDDGVRGDRDVHLERQICRLTGADAATCVNNNAAAVLLVLNTLALRKEVLTSRGELIEIGGSFRMPDIMTRAGCRLREVGTTNRVHLSDYADAIGPKTGLVMKVHTSNYAIVGFTSSVTEAELAPLCRDRGVAFVVDLGSGSLIDLRRYGLPHEPTPSETLAHGADLVTFSGDKLLGGPQAGVIAGRADLVTRIKKNPLRRALRVDKLTVAALSAVLALYDDPDRLPERLPVIRLLTRPLGEIRAMAERVRPAVATALGELGSVTIIDCESQIGSGALPTAAIPSAGLAIDPPSTKRGAGTQLDALARRFRSLPVPVVGRIQDGRLILDLRCLEDEATFVSQLTR